MSLFKNETFTDHSPSLWEHVLLFSYILDDYELSESKDSVS